VSVLNEHLDQVAVDSGVILDMAKVTFFGSAGLASLLMVIQRGVDIYLVGSQQVVRTVKLCGIDDQVKLFRSVADATESAVLMSS
jgi:anti-anti-sigma factor